MSKVLTIAAGLPDWATFNPVTGEIEATPPAGTADVSVENVLLQSDAMTSPWAGVNLTLPASANPDLHPDVPTFSLTENTTDDEHRFAQVYANDAFADDELVGIYFWLDDIGAAKQLDVSVRGKDFTFHNVRFNPADGSGVITSGSPTIITKQTNVLGKDRVGFYFDTGSGAATVSVTARVTESDGTQSYVGSGNAVIDVAGFMLSKWLGFMPAYVPTVTEKVTGNPYAANVAAVDGAGELSSAQVIPFYVNEPAPVHPYQFNGDFCVIPAAGYHSNVPADKDSVTYQWEYRNGQGSAEFGHIKGVPDLGDLLALGASNAPVVPYRFYLDEDSAVSVNVRGMRDDGGSVRSYLWIDDPAVNTEAPYPGYSWSYNQASDVLISPVLTKGEHILYLGMNRTNISFDRLIISKDTAYVAANDEAAANALPLSVAQAVSQGGIILPNSASLSGFVTKNVGAASYGGAVG